MDRFFFNGDEKSFFERVLRSGLEQPVGGYQWWVIRLALAQSLKLDEEPDLRFRAPRERESQIHIEQMTGEYDGAMRLMLSLKHSRDLFSDDDTYADLLQRHARRGLEIMRASWSPGKSFHDYLLDELYAGAGSISDASLPSGWGLDADVIARGLREIGVKSRSAADPIDGPRLTRFALTLDGVDDYDRLRKGLDDLAFTIGLTTGGLALSREAGERRVVLDVPRPSSTWRDVPWSSIRADLENRREALPVSPGVGLLGRPVIFDLAEAPHLFVAGATGSGKSVCLNAIILSLLSAPAAKAADLILIDPKGVDFADYDGCVRLRDRKVVTDMAEGVNILRGLVEEMEIRQEVLRDHGARNIAEAQTNGSSLRRLVVVIDELADFLIGKSGALEPLVRLAQKARAGGIHLVLATQRPEAATFPGLLRANIPSRIALTVQKASDSRIILDEGGAESLLMRGDMLVKLAGRDPVRVHGARVEPRDVKLAVSQTEGR